MGRKKKSKKIAQYVMVLVGAILMALSYGISHYGINGYLAEVHSEMFGAGIALFLAGLVWLIFKIKLD